MDICVWSCSKLNSDKIQLLNIFQAQSLALGPGGGEVGVEAGGVWEVPLLTDSSLC